MPQAIPRNEQHELRRQLESRRDELEREIEESVNESEQRADLRGQVHDEVDEAVADDLGENALAEAERASEEFDSVERALSRMDAGSYGLCVVCGDAIEPERLRAEPAAERCIDDQRRLERETAARSPSL